MNTLTLKPYSLLEFKDYSNETVFEIKNADFDNVSFEEGKVVYSFLGCKFRKVSIVNSEKIEFKDISVQFVDCYIKDLQVNNIVSENISLHIGSSIVAGRVSSNLITNVTVNNSIACDHLFLLNQNMVNISFTEENIYPIKWRRLFKSLSIKDVSEFLKTKQSFYIYDTKKVLFRANEAKNGKAGLVKDTLNRGRQYKTKYQLNNTEKSNLNLNISMIYKEEIEQAELKIIDTPLASLSIKGKYNGKMSIDNCKIDSLHIHEFNINGEAIFFNIKPRVATNKASKIEIHQSNLDNSWLDSFRFNEYDTVSFYRTRFGKSKFSSCSFPTDYTSFEKFKTLENIHYPEKKSDNYYKDQYEIFLQLKNALEANGNFYEAQKLQAIANDALKKISDVGKWDKTILWINSKSNNHGLSITLPLRYFFLFTVSLYLLYLISLGRIFNSNELDLSLIGYYFSFIDLTHRTDFLVDKKEYNMLSLSIDFINKIVAGFFIYQFISAFRKYGKK